MDELIGSFLEEQKCASVCVVGENGDPYCFNCFYAFNGEKAVLYFKSSADTRHMQILANDPRVAGTILPGTLHPLETRGIQFTGILLPLLHDSTRQSSMRYYAKYPFALAIPGEVRTIQLQDLKLSFKKAGRQAKILWSRDED